MTHEEGDTEPVHLSHRSDLYWEYDGTTWWNLLLRHPKDTSGWLGAYMRGIEEIHAVFSKTITDKYPVEPIIRLPINLNEDEARNTIITTLRLSGAV